MTSPSRVGAHSPASPRLPSPPPFPEVQIGPRSPSPSSTHSSSIHTPDDHPSEDYGAARRIRPGTKAADMALGPPLVPLAELDSAFQLQEHLKSLYLAATTSSSHKDHTQPITRASATSLATPPTGIDRSLWLYELCRFLVQRANTLIVGFFADTPPCSAVNCPEMRASEWQYLCAVHDPPKSCCAIDYCCHTLDWAATILTSQRHFPSRLTLGPSGKEGSNASQGGDTASVRQLTNIFRRVYRMFAHAWFQHKEVFWAIENEEGLYMFYKTVCDIYSLIPEENYTIPPEAEGLPEVVAASAQDEEWTHQPMQGGSNAAEQARSARPTSLDLSRGISTASSDTTSTDPSAALGTGATTRRHKHTPSTGSFVTTIHEGDEESPAATSTTFSNQSPPIAVAVDDTTKPKTPQTALLTDQSEKASLSEDDKVEPQMAEQQISTLTPPTIIEPSGTASESALAEADAESGTKITAEEVAADDENSESIKVPDTVEPKGDVKADTEEVGEEDPGSEESGEDSKEGEEKVDDVKGG